jgi:hypothetical protein
LVATVRGGKADDTDVIIEVQSLFGQAIIFGAHRATLLRRLGRTALDERGMEEIIAVIRTSLVRQLA